MPTPSNDTGETKHDPGAVPTLLIPDEISQGTLIELFDALEQADFRVRHRDGVETEGPVAYDIPRPIGAREDELIGTMPIPDPPTDYEDAYQQARNDILAGAAFDAAVTILGRYMAAVQHLLDAEAADPDFEEPGRKAMIEAMKTAEDQVGTAILDIAWDHLEANR